MKGTATSRLDERRSRNKKKKKGRKWNAQGLFQFSPRRYVISGWEEISQAQEKSRTTLIPKIPPCLRRSFLASRISSFSLGWRVARNHSNQESTRYILRWEDRLRSFNLATFISVFTFSFFFFFFAQKFWIPYLFKILSRKYLFVSFVTIINFHRMVERKAVKGINCMKFSQLNARVRKKRKGKQILQVLPALLFSLPRYITFEIPVRRAESTKRGGSRLVSYEYNAPFSVSPSLPSFIPFSHCLHVCTCVHRAFPRDRDFSRYSRNQDLSPLYRVSMEN